MAIEQNEYILDLELRLNDGELEAKCPNTTYIQRVKGAAWTSFDGWISVANLTAQLQAELGESSS